MMKLETLILLKSFKTEILMHTVAMPLLLFVRSNTFLGRLRSSPR